MGFASHTCQYVMEVTDYLDYSRLNVATKADPFPLPHIDQLIDNLNLISTLNLAKSYHQVPVHPDSIPKTALVMPWGKWEYQQETIEGISRTFKLLPAIHPRLWHNGSTTYRYHNKAGTRLSFLDRRKRTGLRTSLV